MKIYITDDNTTKNPYVIAATECVLQLRAKKLEGYDRSSTIMTMTILTCSSSLMEENKVAKAADVSNAAVAAMRSFYCFHLN